MLWEGLEGEKGRGNNLFFIRISKLKEIILKEEIAREYLKKKQRRLLDKRVDWKLSCVRQCENINKKTNPLFQRDKEKSFGNHKSSDRHLERRKPCQNQLLLVAPWLGGGGKAKASSKKLKENGVL